VFVHCGASGDAQILLQVSARLGQVLANGGGIDAKRRRNLSRAETVYAPGHDLTLFRRQIGKRGEDGLRLITIPPPSLTK
jgi:hypothetical protein